MRVGISRLNHKKSVARSTLAELQGGQVDGAAGGLPA